MIMGNMIPKIIDRYPETEKKFAQFIPDVQFMAKIKNLQLITDMLEVW